MTPTDRRRSLVGTAGALLAASAVTLAASTAAHADLDMFITVEAGKVVTGGFDHDLEEVVVPPSLRLFETELFELASGIFGADEPGVTSDLVGDTFTLNFMAGVREWDGSAFTSSTSVFDISYGSEVFDTTTGGSLSFLVPDDMDEHPDYVLQGGEPDDPTAFLIELTISIDGAIDSDSIFVAFNSGLDDGQFEDALGWIETTLIPAPGALALLGLGGLVRRRRR